MAYSHAVRPHRGPACLVARAAPLLALTAALTWPLTGHAGSALSVSSYCDAAGSHCHSTMVNLAAPAPGQVLRGTAGAVDAAPFGGANINAYASLGALGIAAQDWASNSGSPFDTRLAAHHASANAEVAFWDTVTFQGNGMTGQRGFALLTLRLNGSLAATVGGPQPVSFQEATVSWGVSVGASTVSDDGGIGQSLGWEAIGGQHLANEHGSSAYYQQRHYRVDGSTPYTFGPSVNDPRLPDTVTMKLPIVIGQPVWLNMQLSLGANAEAGP
ncbi:MAG: hypothetical protein HY020_17565, partial [Burkholderiales bacterium]|nr:hypothetical protein [Burkholderiales bacterium]